MCVCALAGNSKPVEITALKARVKLRAYMKSAVCIRQNAKTLWFILHASPAVALGWLDGQEIRSLLKEDATATTHEAAAEAPIWSKTSRDRLAL